MKKFIIIIFMLFSVTLFAQNKYIEFSPDNTEGSMEKQYLYKDHGSQIKINGEGHRWADGESTFVYKIDLFDVQKEVLILDVCHDYKVEMSFNDKDYFTVLESPKDVHDDSNRGEKFIDLKKHLKGKQVIYLRFSDRSPSNGWGSDLYSLYIGSKEYKTFGGIFFQGESFFKIHNVNTRGEAVDMEFEKEWFWFGYYDEGELLRRSNFHQGLKLFLTAGIMNKYLLNAEFDIEKYNSSWNYNRREPIEEFSPFYDDGAFVISLETIQEKSTDVKNKITIGKIYPQYTTYTFQKRHNGIMWESKSRKFKFTASGSRLKKFNNTSQYLVSARGETKLDHINIGASCVMSRYDSKAVSTGNDSFCGQRDGSTPSVYIKISDRTSHDWWGAKLWGVTIYNIQANQTNFYDQFQPGDGNEAQYLFDVHGNYDLDVGANMRGADENGYFVYRFPLSEDSESLLFQLDIAQDYLVEVSLDGINYHIVKEGEGHTDDNRNVESFIVNLLPKIKFQTYVDVTIEDDSPEDGWGGDLFRLEYYENDQLKISFSPDDTPGSMEEQYLKPGSDSSYNEGHRYADCSASFTYRIPMSSDINKIKVVLDIQHDYKITLKVAGVEKVVVHAPGNVQADYNRELVTVELNSYNDLYKNTYVKSGTTVIGFDLSTKIFKTELKAEFARSIEHRIYCDGKRKNIGYNAWYFQSYRKFKFLTSDIKTEYFYIDPFYDASVSVDDNDDNDGLIDELEPYEVAYPRLEYEPLKDNDNNNINDEDEPDTDPDYLYDVNQQGYKIKTTSKLFKDLTTLLFYSEIKEISTGKSGQKCGSKLDLYKNIRKDISLIGRYRIFYYKDDRKNSTNPKNLKNYFKTMFYYRGIKHFDMGMGMERIWINKNYIEENTNLDSEFIVKSRCNLKPLSKFRVMPLFQIIFTRKMWINPDYDMYEEWNQYIPGILFEYKLAEKSTAYINYRYVYTFDIKNSANHNFYNFFEIGTESHGAVFMKIFYRFVEKIYIKKARKSDNWKAGNFFGEVKFWF